MFQKKLHIVLADRCKDSKSLVEALLRMTRSEFELDYYADLTELLSEAKKSQNIDVLLLDLDFEDYSGLQCFYKVKSELPHLPIVILSQYSGDAMAIQAIKDGAQEFLVKSKLNASHLFRTVYFAIQRKQAERELQEIQHQFQELSLNIEEKYLEVTFLQESLEKANTELQGLNELKNKFLGMASHDMRNPIAVLLGYIELFSDQALGEVPKNQLVIFDKMKATCNSLLSIINNFLDVSVIESGNLELRRDPVDVLAFVKEVHETNSLIAKTKGIMLALDVPSDLPVAIMDADRMTQVLNNLISNAIKYSYPHSVVTLKMSVAADHLLFAVADEGQGIPKEEIKNLFAAFQTTSTKSTAGEKSTGLGLAIVKRIVEEHGGKIWVDSELERGSVFTFSLPLKKTLNEVVEEDAGLLQ